VIASKDVNHATKDVSARTALKDVVERIAYNEFL
jgi:hypothetical protein